MNSCSGVMHGGATTFGERGGRIRIIKVVVRSKIMYCLLLLRLEMYHKEDILLSVASVDLTSDDGNEEPKRQGLNDFDTAPLSFSSNQEARPGQQHFLPSEYASST
jgi:hypothetical protein